MGDFFFFQNANFTALGMRTMWTMLIEFYIFSFTELKRKLEEKKKVD